MLNLLEEDDVVSAIAVVVVNGGGFEIPMVADVTLDLGLGCRGSLLPVSVKTGRRKYTTMSY